MIFLENNVFEEALDRIRFIYDHHDDVIVSVSGGKDSTILLEMTIMVARERNRLPVKAFFLDQEVEWQGTIDYINKTMRREEVQPYWYQIPFDFTNALSHKRNFVKLWDPLEKDKWIHPYSDISIKENPSEYHRFHDLAANLQNYMTDSEECAVLVGLTMYESPARRLCITTGRYNVNGITWCTRKNNRTRTYWPVYDFKDDDVWTAIAKNKWDYNSVYDQYYRYGVKKKEMRISALIHEMAYGSLQFLQEIEPRTYDKLLIRVPGIDTFAHAYDMGSITPKELPFAFSSWKEYRDYLLVKLVKPEYWELFKKRWKKQNDEDWYRVHVNEVITNDIDGTQNDNYKITKRLMERKAAGYYKNREMEEFNKYMEGQK